MGNSRDGKSPTARKYAREPPVDGKLGKFAKPYAKLLEFDFSSFAKKKTRIASDFGKLLEMLNCINCPLGLRVFLRVGNAWAHCQCLGLISIN